MMKTEHRLRLWRVELVHRNGYHAPYQLVEAKEITRNGLIVNSGQKEIHKQIKEMNLRLLDFPESWSFRLVRLDKKQINGKWID